MEYRSPRAGAPKLASPWFNRYKYDVGRQAQRQQLHPLPDAYDACPPVGHMYIHLMNHYRNRRTRSSASAAPQVQRQPRTETPAAIHERVVLEKNGIVPVRVPTQLVSIAPIRRPLARSPEPPS